MKMNPEQLVTGLGMVFAASVLLPMLKTTTKPLLQGSLAGVTLAGTEAGKRLSFLQEEVEDFMAEVQFERFRKRIDKEIGGESTSQ